MLPTLPRMCSSLLLPENSYSLQSPTQLSSPTWQTPINQGSRDYKSPIQDSRCRKVMFLAFPPGIQSFLFLLPPCLHSPAGSLHMVTRWPAASPASQPTSEQPQQHGSVPDPVVIPGLGPRLLSLAWLGSHASLGTQWLVSEMF